MRQHVGLGHLTASFGSQIANVKNESLLIRFFLLNNNSVI